MQRSLNELQQFFDVIQVLEGSREHMTRLFFDIPLEHDPGSEFFYNNAVPHILASIVERATGERLTDYLQKRLLEPLGIDMRIQPSQREYLDLATTVLSPTSMLKVALLFLQEGAWNGRQLLDPALVRMVGGYHVPNGHPGLPAYSAAGYGFQLWRNAYGGYRFDGGRMQFGIVLPDVDMAACMTANEESVKLLELFHDKIYRQIHQRPLPEDTQGAEARRRAVAGFNLAPKDVCESSPTLSQVDGIVFRFRPNEAGVESFMLKAGSQVEITVVQHGETLSARCGLGGRWATNSSYILFRPDVSFQNAIYGSDAEQCLVSGGWRADTFLFKLRSHASMGEYIAACDFSSGTLTLSFSKAVSVGRASLEHAWKLVSF